ncbi:hypothetical protein A5722_14965 [Mycobacterium vulneris]|nr:hypothetical protein A5722_14965 [Mycolicibacterium vulneris]OCB66223.1 hypothetical protein A5729_12470 [Mycolicibacterium vulneris]
MTPSDRAAEALRDRFRREEAALHAEGYLTIADTMELLGVARFTVNRMIKDGRLHVTRFEDRIVTRPEWVAAVPRSRKASPEWRREHGWLSTAEAAELAGITPQAMNVRIRKGQQAAVRAGADAPTPGVWLIREADVRGQVA